MVIIYLVVKIWRLIGKAYVNTILMAFELYEKF